MRRLLPLCGVVAAAALAAPAGAASSATTSVGVAPLVIPALQRWQPARGVWRLEGSTVIDVRSRDRVAALEATVLAHDLSQVTRDRVPVVTTATPDVSDIVMRTIPAKPQLGREGYRLAISPTAFVISAPNAAGLFYGGRTLLQLIHQGDTVPAGTAEDWPAYPQRGLMVDAARTVYSTGWVLREIRRLAALKLNILHLHLTDDQRWDIASRTFPQIVSKHAFTRADIRRIVALAHRDHITVIPEIEMPGHMASFLKYYPGMTLKPAGAVTPTTSATYSTDKLDITSPAALRAMREILDEYLPLFPGRYWDMGDDEYLSAAEYAAFPQLATYALRHYGAGATPADTLHGFINWVDRIVRAHGKTLRLWSDQMGGTGRVPVNRDVIAEWWNSVSPFGDAVTVSPGSLLAHGYRVLNAGWYPNYYTPNIGPVSGKANLTNVYADWQVNQFDGTDTTSGLITSKQTVRAHAPGLLGSTLNIWGPLTETTAQTAAGIEPHLAVLAQKAWDSPPPAPTYADFAREMRRVGLP
jgi:hexosaminidase